MRSSASSPTNGAFVVDGVLATDRAVPATPQEAAELLADAAARGIAVAPVGGGTALALGNPPQTLDLILSTERLSSIIDYEPTDLVLSVGAGARLGDVQAILGEHGQRLPIDPPGGAETTIGGLIATALWGPLRSNAGTLRDLLIGISVAHPSGTVSKAGGMVVKNVSGYDMPRLYHGSLGTLGVIVSANFKVLPQPRAEATILVPLPDADAAFSAADRLRADGVPLAALEVAREGTGWLLAARLEGREETVDRLGERVASLVGESANRFVSSASRDWWSEYVGRQRLDADAGSVVVRCAVRPRDLKTLVAGITAAMEQLGVDVPYLAATPGVGAVVARLQLGPGGSAELLAEVQALLLGLSDTTTILSAPPHWKHNIDTWGRTPEGFDIMRALRAEFDPSRTINPGRFAGFL
jgi:glycolate oxidase FAD binding subunit